MKTNKLNIVAAIKVIDRLFSEPILEKDKSEHDQILVDTETQNSVLYVFKVLDTRNKKVLKQLAKRLFDDYKQKNPDNTFDLFKKYQLKNAKHLQLSFPNYLHSTEHKKYYSMLERWIKFLSTLNSIEFDISELNIQNFQNTGSKEAIKLRIGTKQYLRYWLCLKKLCQWLASNNIKDLDSYFTQDNDPLFKKLYEFGLLNIIPNKDQKRSDLEENVIWIFQRQPIFKETFISIEIGLKTLLKDITVFQSQTDIQISNYKEKIKEFNLQMIADHKKRDPKFDYKVKVKEIEDKIDRIRQHTNNSPKALQEYIDETRCKYEKYRSKTVFKEDYEYSINIDLENEIVDVGRFGFSEWLAKVYSFLENYEIGFDVNMHDDTKRKNEEKEPPLILNFPEYLKVDESCQEKFANHILKEYKNYSGQEMAFLLMALMDSRLIDIKKYKPIVNAMYEFGFEKITNTKNCTAITKYIYEKQERLDKHNLVIARIKNTLENIQTDNNIFK